MTRKLSVTLTLLFLAVASVAQAGLFLETESFKDLGGWVVDPHSMKHMGSSYIMAHGYGTPVANAKTTFNVPKSGAYTVYARTRDWTAVWKRGTSAGRFQILVNGIELPKVLGTNGEKWDWQKAGTVELAEGKATIELKDLTGFNGRCDAVYLSADPADVPESNNDKLVEFRHKATGVQIRDSKDSFDLIVVGGGMSGIGAALAAERTGSKVLLLQDREVLGGCNSSEIRVGLGGHVNVAPYPNLGNTVREIQPMHGGGGTYSAEFYEDKRKEIVFRRPGCNVKLLFREHVYALEMDPNNPKKIVAVLSRNTYTGQETRFKAPLFVDATGDAVLARMAGCEVMYGRESRSQFNEINAPVEADRQVMGQSVLWYARTRHDEPVEFPDIDWAIPFTDETAYYIRGGDWEQEAGQYRDMAEEAEYIRDYSLLSIYSNWSYLVNHSKRKEEFNRYSIDWVSPIGGKRESYRVVGDLVLNQNDLEDHVYHEDQTGAITWDIDLHFPDPINVERFGEPFRSCAYHRGFGEWYPVPYRCLYARDCDNLFLAGRHISVSHVAFAAVRVMRTLGMLGEVAGMAATICRENDCLPRDVYEKHLDKLKNMMEAGVPKTPLYHAYGGGLYESYHFKELGFIRISPSPSGDLSEELIRRIKDLGMIHRQEHPLLANDGAMNIPNSFGINCADQLDKPITIEGETVLLLWGKSDEKALKTPDITVGKGGVLFCYGRNSLGIWTEAAKTLPDCLTINESGTLQGNGGSHTNLGPVTINGGKIVSEGDGNGSSIMGNFCMAGKVTATGNSRIEAKRISFRSDFAQVDNGSGVFDVPGETDVLTITSDLHVYNGSPKIVKLGSGKLILKGQIDPQLQIEVKAGSVELPDGTVRTK